MKSTEVQLGDLSDIHCRFFTAEIPDLQYLSTLIIEFTGECGFGSSSNDDARFMEGMIAAGFKAWNPSCCILDLRKLKYEWGDMMCVVFNPPHEFISLTDDPVEFPFAAVISDMNREGLLSLVLEEMSGDSTKLLFDSMETAMTRVVEIARKTYPGITRHG